MCSSPETRMGTQTASQRLTALSHLSTAHNRRLRIISTQSDWSHRILRQVIAQFKFWIFQESRKFLPQCERILAGFAECAGGQCDGLRCPDLPSDIIQKRFGSLMAPDMACRNTKRFAPSFGVDGNSSSIRVTIGVATGSRGFSCTASKNCLLAWAQHAACTMLVPPI